MKFYAYFFLTGNLIFVGNLGAHQVYLQAMVNKQPDGEPIAVEEKLAQLSPTIQQTINSLRREGSELPPIPVANIDTSTLSQLFQYTNLAISSFNLPLQYITKELMESVSSSTEFETTAQSIANQILYEENNQFIKLKAGADLLALPLLPTILSEPFIPLLHLGDSRSCNQANQVFNDNNASSQKRELPPTPQDLPTSPPEEEKSELSKQFEELKPTLLTNKEIEDAIKQYRPFILQTEDKELEIKALLKLFELNLLIAKPDTAKFYLERAEKNGDKKIFVRARADLGCFYLEKNDFEKAKKYLTIVSQQDDDLEQKARAIINLGVVSERQRDFAAAINYFEAATTQEDSSFHKWSGYCSLGNIYHNQGDGTKAIQYLHPAAEQNDSLWQKAKANKILGLVHQASKNFSEALKFFSQAVFQNDNPTEKVSAQNCLAVLYLHHYKDVENAIKYYLLSAQQSDNLPSKGTALLSLGYIYETQLVDFGRAIQYYLQALEQPDASTQVQAACKLVNLYTLTQDFQKAHELVQNKLAGRKDLDRDTEIKIDVLNTALKDAEKQSKKGCLVS